MSWEKAIILNPNEQMLHSSEGNCERHHEAMAKALIVYGTVQSRGIHSGTLVLTDEIAVV